MIEDVTVGDVVRDPMRGPIEMSAARAANRAGALLHEALRASALSQQELAKRLDVSAGRVSQVLSGEQNLYLSTLARYLRAMGYGLELGAQPEEPGLREIGRRRRRSPSRDHKITAFVNKTAGSPGGTRVLALVAHEGDAPDNIILDGTYVNAGQVDAMRTRIRLQDATPTAVSATRPERKRIEG